MKILMAAVLSVTALGALMRTCARRRLRLDPGSQPGWRALPPSASGNGRWMT